VGLPPIALLCVVAGLLMGGWLAALSGVLGVAGLWWLQRRLRTRDIERALAWPATLPFPLADWQRWLVDWEDVHNEYLWITFAEPVPKQLVEDALAAVMPDTTPHWLDARQVSLELRGVVGFESAYGSGWVPDVAKTKELVIQVLVPLHGSRPISQVALSRQSPEARATEQCKATARERVAGKNTAKEG